MNTGQHECGNATDNDSSPVMMSVCVVECTQPSKMLHGGHIFGCSMDYSDVHD